MIQIDSSMLVRFTRNKHVKVLFGFAVDQFVATWGIMASAPLVLSSTFNLVLLFGWSYPARHFYPILTGNPYFPVQITLALIMGYLLSDCLGRNSMLWVWVLPFLILCYAVVSLATISPLLASTLLRSGVVQSRLSHYFGWGCRTQDGCLDQILVTMPFYVSVAFSSGALVAKKLQRRSQGESPIRFKAILSMGIILLVATLADLAVSSRKDWRWSFPLIAGVPLVIGTYLVVLALEMRQAGLAAHFEERAGAP